MAVEIEITVRGIREAEKLVARLKSSLGDYSEELNAVGKELKGFFSTVPFETDGSVYGKRWAELTPQYERQKVKKYPGHGILHREGILRTSFTFKPSNRFLEIKNTADYFDYHQGGTGRLPQRKIMQLTPLVRRSLLKSFVEALLDRVSRNLK